MKKFYCIISLLFVLSSYLMGQAERFSLVREGTCWTEKYYRDVSNDLIPSPQEPPVLFTYTVAGDSIMDEIVYKKVYKKEGRQVMPQLNALIREQDNTIYCKTMEDSHTLSDEFILYDFNWSPGKEMRFPDRSYNVDDKDKTYICNVAGQEMFNDGQTYDYVTLPSKWGHCIVYSPHALLIQYFGSTWGVLIPGERFYDVDNGMYPYFNNEVIGIYQDQQLLWLNSNFKEDGTPTGIVDVLQSNTSVRVETTPSGQTELCLFPKSHAIIEIFATNGDRLYYCCTGQDRIVMNGLSKGIYMYRVQFSNGKFEAGRLMVK